ncbi:hypothetical protein ACFL6A_03860, partial [bacterium]
MKTGWKPRWKSLCFILLLLYTIPLFAQWDTWLHVTNLNTGQTLENTPLILKMKLNEIVGLEFNAHYRNTSTDKDYFGTLRGRKLEIPDYFEDWENKSIVLAPGERGSLLSTLYLRPTVAGLDTFLVWSTIRKGPAKTDPTDVSIFNVFLFVDSLDAEQYGLPQLVFDSTRFSRSKHDTVFVRGTSNSISWWPGTGTNIVTQDAFYFHADEYGNLKQSVQQIFKTQAGPSRFAVFENLESGEQYGYIIKATYSTDTDTVLTLYSDVMYSVQDNEPPEKVITPFAKPIFIGGRVQVSWKPVEDQ